MIQTHYPRGSTISLIPISCSYPHRAAHCIPVPCSLHIDQLATSLSHYLIHIGRHTAPLSHYLIHVGCLTASLSCVLILIGWLTASLSHVLFT